MTKDFITKVVEVQSKLRASKDKYNKFGGYYYRSAESILEAAKPLLGQQGLFLTLTDEIVSVNATDGKNWIYVKATATITDGTDEMKVCAYAREPEGKKGMDSSQITGATSSYARKYALNALLLIDDTKEPDTEEYHNQTTNTKNENPSFDGEESSVTQTDAMALKGAIEDAKMSVDVMAKKFGKPLIELTFDQFTQTMNFCEKISDLRKKIADSQFTENAVLKKYGHAGFEDMTLGDIKDALEIIAKHKK